ncbi:MAG: hypothetical protein NZ930_00680 [Candidatus Bipolaricaulota bacterium]|nr:hypothetical protein [Candidatus Bipolaricaulota bacterium]MDW8031218.1 hypothetical protein [Candidatus Bipolaricaulota bacterium]
MNSCTEALSTVVRTEATALKFLDLMLGGFDSEAIEVTVALPEPHTRVFVFAREGGEWKELEGCVERQHKKLRLTLPAGALRHIAVAFVPGKR